LRRRLDAEGGGGKPDREGGAAPAPLALGLDGAAMKLDEGARDGQAQAEPAGSPRRRAVRLAEAIEDVGEECRFDPLAGVRDDQLDVGVLASQPDLDPP